MKWLVYIVFFSSFQLYAQKMVKPVIKMNSSYMMDFGYYSYHGFDYSIGGGVKINNQWLVMLNFNYLKNRRDNISDNHNALQMVTTSISGSYRILNQKYRFSPVIDIDLGLNIWSNAVGLNVDNNLIIYDKTDVDHYVFEKNSILGKSKLLLNINVKSFDFNIGSSFNTYFFRLTSGMAFSTPYYYYNWGIGFEAQVLYTFPMKKRQVKKQAKQAGE